MTNNISIFNLCKVAGLLLLLILVGTMAPAKTSYLIDRFPNSAKFETSSETVSDSDEELEAESDKFDENEEIESSLSKPLTKKIKYCRDLNIDQANDNNRQFSIAYEDENGGNKKYLRYYFAQVNRVVRRTESSKVKKPKWVMNVCEYTYRPSEDGEKQTEAVMCTDDRCTPYAFDLKGVSDVADAFNEKYLKLVKKNIKEDLKGEKVGSSNAESDSEQDELSEATEEENDYKTGGSSATRLVDRKAEKDLEKIADKCDDDDIECNTIGLAKVLKKYKQTIDKTVVMHFYANNISKDLVKQLSSSDKITEDNPALKASSDLIASINKLPYKYLIERIQADATAGTLEAAANYKNKVAQRSNETISQYQNMLDTANSNGDFTTAQQANAMLLNLKTNPTFQLRYLAPDRSQLSNLYNNVYSSLNTGMTGSPMLDSHDVSQYMRKFSLDTSSTIQGMVFNPLTYNPGGAIIPPVSISNGNYPSMMPGQAFNSNPSWLGAPISTPISTPGSQPFGPQPQPLQPGISGLPFTNSGNVPATYSPNQGFVAASVIRQGIGGGPWQPVPTNNGSATFYNNSNINLGPRGNRGQ